MNQVSFWVPDEHVEKEQMARGWQPCLQEKGRCSSWKLFLTAVVFKPMCPISNSIYPHIVQVAVVLKRFWTTSTVRCPITMATVLLVAAGLMLLPDREHTSALQLSGSAPALRNDTIGGHSLLQHHVVGEKLCHLHQTQTTASIWCLKPFMGWALLLGGNSSLHTPH